MSFNGAAVKLRFLLEDFEVVIFSVPKVFGILRKNGIRVDKICRKHVRSVKTEEELWIACCG